MAPNSADLIEKAKEYRRQDLHDDAAICALKATEVDPTDPEGWWILSLSLIQLDKYEDAVKALRKLTEIDPDITVGWEYYGLALSELDRNEEAAAALNKAYALGTENKHALRVLAALHSDSDDEIAYGVLKRLSELGGIDSSHEWNRLGILHTNNEHPYDAIIAYRRAALFKDDPASLFNLGLVYTSAEISQDVDAIDVWRLVLRRYPGKLDRAQASIDKLLPRLLALGKNTRAAGVTLLETNSWYRSYVNPFELLNVDPDTTEVPDAKAIQRYKKKLLAEVELEEGCIAWLDNYVIDRSRAITLCDELNDEQKNAAHWRVFKNSQLLGFLSRGEHALFTADANDSPLDLLEQFEDPDNAFARWLSPYFAAQYNVCLGKALEKRQLAVLESLFDGRRWVTPEHLDQCYEIALRLVAPLLEPLRKAAVEAESVKPTLADLAALINDTSVSVLNLLPTPFRAHQNAAAKFLRDISISCHNVHEDSDLAKQVLELTKNFAFRSASLNHQLEEDYKALLEIISSQRKFEAHLTSGDQSWKITKEYVLRGDRKLDPKNIQSVRWGITTGNGSQEFTIAFLDDKADDFAFKWRATREFDKQQAHFNDLLQATLSYVVPHVVRRIETKLKDGKSVHIGPCRLTDDAVHFEKQGWFSAKPCVVPWSDVATEMVAGEIIVFDRRSPKNRIGMPIESTQNGVLLHFLADRGREAT